MRSLPASADLAEAHVAALLSRDGERESLFAANAAMTVSHALLARPKRAWRKRMGIEPTLDAETSAEQRF